jgi:uncharacterized membrane protein
MHRALAWAGPPWLWWNAGYGWPWAALWLAFAVLFWAGLIAILVWAVRSAQVPHRRPDRAMRALERHLHAGDISEEEYERIKRLLKD